MKFYQIHLNSKDRVKINFKTFDEAANYIRRLRSYTKDRILEGQLGYRNYLEEIELLEIVEIENNTPRDLYSVVEMCHIGGSILSTTPNLKLAKKICEELSEDSTRSFQIIKSRLNG